MFLTCVGHWQMYAHEKVQVQPNQPCYNVPLGSGKCILHYLPPWRRQYQKMSEEEISCFDKLSLNIFQYEPIDYFSEMLTHPFFEMFIFMSLPSLFLLSYSLQYDLSLDFYLPHTYVIPFNLTTQN